jgi:hypothetical protein
MKKITTFVLILFLLSLSTALMADDYLPLKKGLKRTYSINGSTIKTVENFEERKLGKKKVVPQKIEVNGATSFIFIQDSKKGQVLYAEQGADAAEPTLLEDLVYLNKELKTGNTWEGTFKTTLMMEEVSVPMTYEVQKGKETVTVPAGTFDKCIKVIGKGEVEREKGLFGTVKLTVVKTEWYADKIGLIKSVLHKSGNHMLISDEDVITQLTSYEK